MSLRERIRRRAKLLTKDEARRIAANIAKLAMALGCKRIAPDRHGDRGRMGGGYRRTLYSTGAFFSAPNVPPAGNACVSLQSRENDLAAIPQDGGSRYPEKFHGEADNCVRGSDLEIELLFPFHHAGLAPVLLDQLATL